MAAKISCVIPTHRRDGLLRESLMSIVEQSFEPVEIIVASDCLDSAARSVCESVQLASNIPVIYVERDADRPGACVSRNLGASYATGDYIAFLDDDDLWESCYLADVASELEASGKDIVVTWRRIFSDTSSVAGPTIPLGLRASDVVAISLGTTGSNMVVSKSSFVSIDGFDANLPVKNDTDFFYRLLKAGFDYSVVEKRSVLQRKHGQGQLTGKTLRRADGTDMYISKHRHDMRYSDVRRLKVTVHRIRKMHASSRVMKTYHYAMAILNYSPALYREEKRSREIWSVNS